MEEFITLVWDWLGDEEHRARLLVLVPVLGLIGTFLAWFFGLFKRKPAPPTPVVVQQQPPPIPSGAAGVVTLTLEE
jgi:hypothetical protein